MRIAQLISGHGRNGAIQHCHDLSTELALRGHDVLQVHKPGAWIADQPLPPSVIRLESNYRRTPSELRRVANALRNWEADVLHAHMSSACFFGVLLARFFGFRCVATTHMTHWQPHWWWNDRVIAPSLATAKYQQLINWVPKQRLDVIYNFINTERMIPQRPPNEMRQSLGIDSDAFVISVVGEVSARKGQHILIEALPAIIAQGLNPHVILVGAIHEGYSIKLVATIKDLGLVDRISLLEQRSDIADILAATDCYCLPSNREVMPISLLEAMSMGLPAVATRVGGIPECIRDGINGLLVPPNDPEALAMALIELGCDRAMNRSMGEAARLSIHETFSPAACIPRVVQCYEQATRNNKQTKTG